MCPARAPRRGRGPPRTSSAGPARGEPLGFLVVPGRAEGVAKGEAEGGGHSAACAPREQRGEAEAAGLSGRAPAPPASRAPPSRAALATRRAHAKPPTPRDPAPTPLPLPCAGEASAAPGAGGAAGTAAKGGTGPSMAERGEQRGRERAAPSVARSTAAYAPRRGDGPPRTSSAGPARGSPRAFPWCRAGPRAWRARPPRPLPVVPSSCVVSNPPLTLSSFSQARCACTSAPAAAARARARTPAPAAATCTSRPRPPEVRANKRRQQSRDASHILGRPGPGEPSGFLVVPAGPRVVRGRLYLS